MYKEIKKEYAGPTGKAARKYFLESCTRTAITSNLSPRLLNYIQSESLKGRRPESIATSILGRFPHQDRKGVERVVRTAAGMANTAFERARAEEIGIEWYQWATSADSRVRPSHQKMDQVLVNWNDPPSPEELTGEAPPGKYHAGEAEECRCIALPIASLDEVKWPAKVYRNGRIERMSRKHFREIWGGEE
jgi:SPP1 gp7 family putative phage head morphogenesis protein